MLLFNACADTEKNNWTIGNTMFYKKRLGSVPCMFLTHVIRHALQECLMSFVRQILREFILEKQLPHGPQPCIHPQNFSCVRWQFRAPETAEPQKTHQFFIGIVQDARLQGLNVAAKTRENSTRPLVER